MRLATDRLVLEPLRVDHADELAPVLDDPVLHAFTGGSPSTAAELRERYARQVVGRSPDGTQRWLNWVLRADGAAAGYVQATVTGDEAELAWVVGPAFQGHGYAREATAAVMAWLRTSGVGTFVAHIHPGHAASAAVATAVGLAPTGTQMDGETRWQHLGGA